MARRAVFVDTCDSCIQLGFPDVEAEHTHTVAIDGGKVKNISLCDRCEVREFAHLLLVYVEQGQEVEHIERKSRKVKQASEGTAPEPSAEAETDDAAIVWCSLAAEHKVEEPMRMKDKSRNTHAEKVHKRKAWQVPWVYKEDREWFPCTAHQECLDTNYRFSSAIGVIRHIGIVDLKRIDQDA